MRTQAVGSQGVKEALRNNPLLVSKAKRNFGIRVLYDKGCGLPSRAMLGLYVL